MAEARASALWDHTASVLTLLANAHRDPKKTRRFRLRDFHPYRRRRRAPVKSHISVARLADEIMALADAGHRSTGRKGTR